MTWIKPGNKFFAGFDALSGFDMLAVAEEAQRLFCINTVFGTYRMTGSPMGYKNTPKIYMDRMVEQILGGVGEKNAESLFGRSQSGPKWNGVVES